MHSHMEMGIMIRQEVAVVPVFLGSCLFFVCENSVPVHITSFILDEKAEHPHRLTLKRSIDVTALQIALYIVLQTAMRINTCEWARRMRDILHPRRLWSLYIVLH